MYVVAFSFIFLDITNSGDIICPTTSSIASDSLLVILIEFKYFKHSLNAGYSSSIIFFAFSKSSFLIFLVWATIFRYIYRFFHLSNNLSTLILSAKYLSQLDFDSYNSIKSFIFSSV